MAAKAGRKGSVSARRGVKSIDVGMRILEVLASAHEPLPLKTISEGVGMAPSNVHRYLASFMRFGLLRQDEETLRYDLGKLAMRVGLSALARLDVLELARPELQRLARDSGLIALASVFGNQGPTVVRLQQPSPPVFVPLALGSVLPLLRSPTGLVFLSYLPPEMTKPIVDRELVQNKRYSLAASTPKSIAEVKRVIAQIQKAGYAINDVDVSPGLRAVACPILNLQHEVAAVLSLTGPDSTIAPGHPVVEELVATCARLSEEAGSSKI